MRPCNTRFLSIFLIKPGYVYLFKKFQKDLAILRSNEFHVTTMLQDLAKGHVVYTKLLMETVKFTLMTQKCRYLHSKDLIRSSSFYLLELDSHPWCWHM